MDWTSYQHEFAAVDALSQIIVTDTTEQDWQKILNFLKKTEVGLTFFSDGVKTALPSPLAPVFRNDGHHYRLALLFDEVTLSCDFARQDAIVLRFDPHQITNEAKATLLFRVMSTFGRRLKKVVVLTAVNREAQPAFRYEPGQGLIYLKLARKLAPYA